MKRMLLILSAVVCFAASVSAQTNIKTVSSPVEEYETSTFYKNDYVHKITLKTRQGEVLASLVIPSDVFLSIHSSIAAVKKRDSGGTPILFEGNISIRTKPRNQMVQGPAYEQMMKAPLRLDVQDSVVELEIEQ